MSLFAFNSNISVSKIIEERRSSIPSPVLAEIGIACIYPPQSSTKTSLSDNSLLTFSISMSGKSILLIAIISGTSAALRGQ